MKSRAGGAPERLRRRDVEGFLATRARPETAPQGGDSKAYGPSSHFDAPYPRVTIASRHEGSRDAKRSGQRY